MKIVSIKCQQCSERIIITNKIKQDKENIKKDGVLIFVCPHCKKYTGVRL